ncbi:alpha/beta fold hydrolase, partial [Jatrophihabitans endophyticus]|uniref:alpha/beta fold hydrolase n=1 Tax=Jatrophihabitans endophyticus TaxID=1206085 RepID=UPI001A022FFC
MSAPASPTEATFDIGPFAFERGGRVEAMRVGFVSAGRLNPARDNAVLLLAETSGHRHSYDALIGPGLAYDTDRHFVVVVDPIGGGASTGPGDGLGRAFPPYTIRDMVRVQHAFVTKGLKLDGLAAVGGSSMGSFQALEWGILF